MTGAPGPKYTINDFQGANMEQKSFNAMVAIANELHNIYSVLWEIKERK
ncbi:hypothetical protein JXA85_08450 [Candidatus Woesearchaeota archaeon]|nr:hypothetical protein [Candidatus Woesearchaeota archaeon]